MDERMTNDLITFQNDINDYNYYCTNLEQHFQDMVDHMNALNGMWEGEAHDTFLQTFESDKQKTLSMIEDLKRILAELRFAHTQYSDCENTVSAMIEQIPV